MKQHNCFAQQKYVLSIKSAYHNIFFFYHSNKKQTYVYVLYMYI